MKYLPFFIVLLCSTPFFSQQNDVDQALSELEKMVPQELENKESEAIAETNSTQKKDYTIEDKKASVKETRASRKKLEKRFKKLARNRAIEILKSLKLSYSAGVVLENSIYKFSLKAHKVINSSMSANEKSKELSNIIYFQNEELKKVFTVHQFYKYVNLTYNRKSQERSIDDTPAVRSYDNNTAKQPVVSF